MAGRYKTDDKCGIIILAAGRSARLGSPKQLHPYADKNLLQHSIDVAVESSMKPVIVVLGSEIEEIERKIDNSEVIIAKNPDWESGMASSVVCGIKTLNKLHPDIESVILMVCDQPFVNPGLLNDLVRKHMESGSSIVASSYENIMGTPALFHKKHFPELASLEGDTGAKSLFKKHAEILQTIPFEKGGIDIDTIEDY